jgi:ribonuclease-3
MIDPSENAPVVRSSAATTAEPTVGVDRFEAISGYRFRHPGYLEEALTHSSYANELNASSDKPLPNNERFEFLGDAVIGLVVAQLLMERYPEASEGRLSRWRSLLVSRRALAEIAVQYRLGESLRLGRGELRSGGAEKRSLLAGVFEALIGAIYLDGATAEDPGRGLVGARAVLERWFGPWLDAVGADDRMPGPLVDRKTFLQERTQALYKVTPSYRLVESWGREHEKQFRVEIALGTRVLATGMGRSKKDAEQDAAQRALERLALEGHPPHTEVLTSTTTVVETTTTTITVTETEITP